MARAHDCTTLEEAWTLIGHHLTNKFLEMGSALRKIKEMPDGGERDQQEDLFWRTYSELVGSLHLISQQMLKNRHIIEALEIKRILMLFMGKEATDPNVWKEIIAKYDELKSE